MQRRRGRMLAQGLGLAAAFGVLIALPQTAAEGVRSGLTLCGQVILPSLFPFFVCSNLFVLLGFSARVSARFGGLAARLLRLPPNAGSAFVIGMTGGYPAGAQAVGLLYERGELSRDEAEHALAVCNQAGPSFIFGFLGGAVFAHPGAGALLCGVQLAAAVLTCRLTAKPLTAAQRAHSAPQRQAQPDFAAAFSESVRRAGMSAIHVCMFVTVFSVLSGYLRLAAGAHLPADAAPLALGALELSAGCAALRACTLAPVWKLCIASFLLSFGGLSILAQSRAAAADAGLEGRQLPGCKMLQGAIAAALTLLLAPLVQAERWCAPTLGASTMMETAGPVMLLVSSVLLLYFRKKYHSILREGRV